MVDLEYYDAWYKKGPFIHKSIGVTLVLIMTFRLIWKWKNPKPKPEPNLTVLEKKVSHWVHYAMYAFFFLIAISGYLISTADGRAVSVFDIFEVPAVIYDIEHQEDIAGEVHEYLGWILLVIVFLHIAGALKHHFIDKDRTLKRMLGIRSKSNV
jgi:cytochrome b561